MTPDDWHAVIQTNLDGVFYCSKLGAEVLRDGGRIVNIASIAGIAGFHGQANYAAAKAGVIALTKVLAKELARRRHHGQRRRPRRDPHADARRGSSRKCWRSTRSKSRSAALGRPEDVANAVLFLACEESEYITGQTLPITGGWF